MSEAILGLTPEPVWRYFAEIARIPRGSKNEAQVSRYVVETAKRLGLSAKQDAVGNVLVSKNATPGRERAPRVCLQGHLDMVCEKNAETQHDFTKDPIRLVRKGNVLMADGTTLGADNGIAVATNLALMEARDVAHGPLELLFTIDEETGLTGAKALAPGFVESRTLINLDSEEEGALYVGCAGGRGNIGTWTVLLEPSPPKHAAAKLVVKGLRGGHSGLDIDKGRGNAVKILSRALWQLLPFGVRVATLSGGNKHNAIPREAEALLFVPKDRLEPVQGEIAALAAKVKAELQSVDPDVVLTLEVAAKVKKGRVVKRPQVKKVVQTLLALPHGVIRMSADIPGLVETSTNVATIATAQRSIRVVTSQRSSVASELDEVCQSVAATLGLGGAAVETGDGYPGWKPNLASPILKAAQEAYRKLYGKEPAVKAIHAGLECGIIGERYPGMDMVSAGPTLEAVHSPDEKIYIDTVDRFWQLVTTILRDVN